MKKHAVLPIIIVCLFLLTGCGGGSGSGESSGSQDYSDDFKLFLSDVITVFPAKNNSPYANVLAECVYSRKWDGSCMLSTLPLIGQDHDSPSEEHVMERVLVSHQWMADNFNALIKEMPADMLTLFKSVTAIVISADIRPSFYNTITGAVYLDPASLWLTYEEKMTIDRGADYRSGFGTDLNYRTLSRFIKDNEYAYTGFSWDSEEDRTLEDIKFYMADLLYHELCHANDFLPHYNNNKVPLDQTIFEAILTYPYVMLSSQLTARYPLTSNTLFELAKVKFRGASPTNKQTVFTPEEVAMEFKQDLTNSDYSYVSRLEDIAMIFSEVMLKYHFDIDRDFAITSVPQNENPSANDYIVAWGMRNRTASPGVKEKAEQAAAYLLPETDFTAFFHELSAPLEMASAAGWIDNLTLDEVKTAKLQLQKNLFTKQDSRKYASELLPPL